MKIKAWKFIAPILLKIWILDGFGDYLRCFVAKFTVTNLNKNFTNTGRGEGGLPFCENFS